MLGNYRGALGLRPEPVNAGPKEYWVRCEDNGAVTSGPFTLQGAKDRAIANVREFGGSYAVVRPDVDDKGPRTYVADVVAGPYYPLDV